MNDPLWWQEGVIYQIYPRSVADENPDGIVDLRGTGGHPRELLLSAHAAGRPGIIGDGLALRPYEACLLRRA